MTWGKFSSFLLLLLIIATLSILLSKGTLQDVHWDVPNYPYEAKRFAETDYLINYRANSHQVAELVPSGTMDTTYSYWIFSRLGSVVILGVITSILGTDVTSLEIAAVFYSVLLAIAAFLCFVLANTIVHLMGPSPQKKLLLSGALISTVLFIFSDIYVYMTGNLISEVPALVLMNCAAILLIYALKRQSYIFAVFSGFFIFLTYAVRQDAVFYILAFIISLGIWMFRAGSRGAWWHGIFLSGGVATALYVVYAWAFYPLADPWLFLEFGKTWGNKFENWESLEKGFGQLIVSNFQMLIAAGGLLWIGALFSIVDIRKSAPLKFAWLWFLFSISPWILRFTISGGGLIQVRMVAFLVLPLFIASTFGWSGVFQRLLNSRRWTQWKILAVFVTLSLLVAISHDVTYQILRNLPGGWRLQYVRNILLVPNYQRKSYPIYSMELISDRLYANDVAKVVFVSEEIDIDSVNLIRYLGPPYHQELDLTLYPEPQVWRGDPIPGVESVVFRKWTNQQTIKEAIESGLCVMMLSKSPPTESAPRKRLQLERISGDESCIADETEKAFRKAVTPTEFDPLILIEPAHSSKGHRIRLNKIPN